MKQLAKCQNVIINKYILTILSFSGVQQSLYRFLIHPSATTFCLLGGAYCSLKHFLIYLACVFPLPSLCFSYVSLSLLTHLVSYATGCSLNSVFFSKNSRKFATSPSPALGCYWLYKNYQPIGMTVHSHCVESFEGVLQR